MDSEKYHNSSNINMIDDSLILSLMVGVSWNILKKFTKDKYLGPNQYLMKQNF